MSPATKSNSVVESYFPKRLYTQMTYVGMSQEGGKRIARFITVESSNKRKVEKEVQISESSTQIDEGTHVPTFLSVAFRSKKTRVTVLKVTRKNVLIYKVTPWGQGLFRLRLNNF